MKSLSAILIVTVTLSLSLWGCARHEGRIDTDSITDHQVSLENDITAEAMAWADSVCESMSLRQRIGQLFMPAVYARAGAQDITAITRYAETLNVGGLILLMGDVRSVSTIADTLSKMSGILPFLAIDAEWGPGMRLSDAPVFPVNGSLGEGTDDELMFDYGLEVARECRRMGINMVLGPVLDVAEKRSFIGRRSFGNDRERVAELGIAYAKGIEAGNVISVAKHFPGHGAVSDDSHKRLPVISRSLHALDSIDLYPFKKYIASGLTGIMIGHLSVPALDNEPIPAAASHTVINDLLREDMRFDRLVLTDALNMKGAEGFGAISALKAGVDMVMAPESTDDAIREVENAVANGELRGADIDEKVKRILFFKYLFSLHRKHGVDTVGIVGDVNSGKAYELKLKLSDSGK